jgi:hypothetical protein
MGKLLKSLVVTLSILGTCALFAPTEAAAIPTSSLSISSSTIYVDNTFTVDVYANNVTDLMTDGSFDEVYAFGFDVNAP